MRDDQDVARVGRDVRRVQRARVVELARSSAIRAQRLTERRQWFQLARMRARRNLALQQRAHLHRDAGRKACVVHDRHGDRVCECRVVLRDCRLRVLRRSKWVVHCQTFWREVALNGFE